MVSTGSVTSGSSDTGILPNETDPRRTTPRVAAMVETGRRIAAAGKDIGVESWDEGQTAAAIKWWDVTCGM